jgi:hypothetical protein
MPIVCRLDGFGTGGVAEEGNPAGSIIASVWLHLWTCILAREKTAFFSDMIVSADGHLTFFLF